MVTDRKIGLFKIKEIWFSDNIFDVKDCHSVSFITNKDNFNLDGFNCVKSQTLTIDLIQSLDIIWDGFSKKSCRYEIKRAGRDGVKIQINQDYSKYCDLDRSFRKLKRLQRTFDDEYIKDYGTLFTAYIQDELIAGQVYLEDKNNIRWIIGASKRLESNNPIIGCANRALIWEAIKYAKDRNIKVFDFGGYYAGNEVKDALAVNFFKQSFGGKIVDRFVYSKIYSLKYKLSKRIVNLVRRTD